MKAESNPMLQGLRTCEDTSWFKCQGCLILCLVSAKEPRLEHAHNLQGLKSIPKFFRWNYQKTTACGSYAPVQLSIALWQGDMFWRKKNVIWFQQVNDFRHKVKTSWLLGKGPPAWGTMLSEEQEHCTARNLWWATDWSNRMAPIL